MFLIFKTFLFAVPNKTQMGKSNQWGLPLEKWNMDVYNFLWWEIKYDRTFS